MSLDDSYDTLRGIINDCRGYRVLTDSDVLRRGDETVCASTLLAGHEDWHEMKPDEWAEYFDRTVAWATSDDRDDMDATERLFRRRTT